MLENRNIINLVPEYEIVITMYVRDIKTDFFDVISTERGLVLVNTDVDAVCATKIIQYLFKWSPSQGRGISTPPSRII